MSSGVTSPTPAAYCTNCGSRLQNSARFCSRCGTAVKFANNPVPPALPASGEDLFVQALTLSLAKNSNIPAIPLLQNALELGLDPKEQAEAHLSLGEAYREIVGNSGLSWQKMVEAREFGQCLGEVEKALELDRTCSIGFFGKPLNIGRLKDLDLMYTLAARAKQEQEGLEAAVAYLSGKLKAVDYLPRPPLLLSLVELGDLYRRSGAFESAVECLQKVLGTEPLYPADEERNEEVRANAGRILSEIRHIRH